MLKVKVVGLVPGAAVADRGTFI